MGRSRNPSPLHQAEAPPSAPGWPEIEAESKRRLTGGRGAGRVTLSAAAERQVEAAGSPPGLPPPSLRRLLLKRSLQLKLQHHKSGTPLTQEGKELGPPVSRSGG